MSSNIINIQKGQIIKNYNEMCKLLNLEPTKGKGRQYHIREFERYCEYYKDGHKFIIKEVYNKPKEKIDLRVENGGNNTKYEDLMDKLIINILIEHGGSIEESFIGIIELLDLFTKEYKLLCQMEHKRYSMAKNIKAGLILTYRQKLHNIVRKCFETSINRLKKNGTLDYEIKRTIRDSDFNVKIADEKMKELILKTETQIYEEMGIEHFNRIIPSVNRNFKNNVSKRIGIKGYWDVYDIELTRNVDIVNEDKDELIRRLIKSINQAVRNKKYKNEYGEVIYPYLYGKYDRDIEKLTKLIWKVPRGYVSEFELDEIIDEEWEQEEFKNTGVPF